MASYDFKEIEPVILDFWNSARIYEKAKKKNIGKKKFYFLDGPPYTSGTVHIGTAWNKSMKDLVVRYKRMSGFDTWDRAGYDMHGLPTEAKIRVKHNLFFKKDIEAFGVAKYNKECEQFAIEMMQHMNTTFDRLGVWLDFKNAYMPITKEFIEGEWWLIKRAHDQKRLYQGLRTMSWCANCQTNLAKHELEYNSITDESIFVKFAVKNKPNEYLIIWTTTPWTIPFNLAIMVNPELEYVRVQVDNEVWILAKVLANMVVQGVVNKTPKVIDTFLGEKLEGVEYVHPFADTISEYKSIKQQSPKVHTVVLSSEYVDTTAGSGLVHCAPGCGPEDYEVGHRNGIAAWNAVDEQGKFSPIMGEFAGLIAKKDDSKFIAGLEKRGAIVAKSPVEHDYGHCQRCHKPIIFRTTKQWFFKVEDLKPRMIELNNKTYWVPKAAFNAFDSWLKNLRDNSITKQNYWGTPVPIWECLCGKYDVISTVAELEKKSSMKVTELHKPWIDRIEIPCACGKIMQRIPDVLDVWVDAGTASWNCLDYPQRKDLFEKLFPADFILEGKDQIRGWFNLLMVAGLLGFNAQSFKAVYMHGYIQDSSGRKMSKSLGNYIEPKEVVDKYGADTFRYYAIGGANPGVDFNYNHEDAKTKHKNLIVLWNVQNFVSDLAKELKVSPCDLDETLMTSLCDVEERFIISKLNSTMKRVTELFEEYRVSEIPGVIEEFFLEFSRTYIQMVREKAAIGDDDERKVVLYVAAKCITEVMKLFAPVAPFITEKMWQELRSWGLQEESVHLCSWPKFNAKSINSKLEKQMEIASTIVQGILAAREKAKLSVRWPVKLVQVVSNDAEVLNVVKELEDVIKKQTNCKELNGVAELAEIKIILRANAGMMGKSFGAKSPKIIAKLSQLNPKAVLAQLSKESKYALQVDNEKIELNKDHIIIEREVPKKYVEAECKNIFFYLCTERTDELEAEGFAREIMRRVQQSRKDSSLKKVDRINLFLHVSEDLSKMLEPWSSKIKEKCGAAVCKIGTKSPIKQHKFSAEEKIKDEAIKIFFDKVETL